ncbi:hypothetical protein T06_12471 [Trichinella sp. T6]|nr:hypothetical protein T06_12471 [Trichinella sp. T6]
MSFPLPSKEKIHPPLQVSDFLLVTASAQWNPLSVDHRSSLSSVLCTLGLFGVSRADCGFPFQQHIPCLCRFPPQTIPSAMFLLQTDKTEVEPAYTSTSFWHRMFGMAHT